MIQNKELLRNEKDDREFQNRPDLSGISTLRVVTEDGTYVGNLTTVQIDQQTGKLTAIETSGSGILDLLRRPKEISIAEVISIGTDVVIVPDSYASGEQRQKAKEGEGKDGSDQMFQLPAESDDSSHK